MNVSFNFQKKHHLAGSVIEGVVWLVLGLAAISFVGIKIMEQKKNAPPKPVEIMKVATSPSEVEALIKEYLASEHKGAELVELGDFGVIREDRYIGARVKGIDGSPEIQTWIFSGMDDKITFGESTEMIMKRLQQDADRTRNHGRLNFELSQLRKMLKLQ